MDKYARHGLVPKEAKNAVGGVRIGGGRLKICPRHRGFARNEGKLMRRYKARRQISRFTR